MSDFTYRFRLPADLMRCGQSIAQAFTLMEEWRSRILRSGLLLVGQGKGNEDLLMIEIPFNDEILELCPRETAAEGTQRWWAQHT